MQVARTFTTRASLTGTLEDASCRHVVRNYHNLDLSILTMLI